MYISTYFKKEKTLKKDCLGLGFKNPSVGDNVKIIMSCQELSKPK